MSSAAAPSSRPSDERRYRLGQGIAVPTVSNFFPIERYYTAADTLYEKVMTKAAEKGGVLLDPLSHDATTLHPLTPAQVQLRQDYLDETYTYAKRYCIFYTDAIPSHNYYGTPRYKTIQNKHTTQLSHVITILEAIAQCMDHYELFRRQQEARAAQEAAQRQQEQLDQWKRDFEHQKTNSIGSDINADTVQQSALDKLNMLLTPQADTDAIQPPPYPGKQSSTRYRLSVSDSDDDTEATNGHSSHWNGVVPLPPPMLPPTASTVTPPSYDSIAGPSQPIRPTTQTTQTGKPLSIRQLQSVYRQQYDKLQASGRIQILSVPTYQGRVSASTNGCTVISALVAAHHMDTTLPKPSSVSTSESCISNALIQHVIDVQCGPILRVIRHKLGLGGHALIIPSDVHDYLVDTKLLHQEYFAGAAGGNVMDHAHYGEFIKLLSSPASNGTKTSKAAATFFFREHVISIVRFQERGQMMFDLIDSLPSSTGNSSRSMTATRTRCSDVESLEALLLWYTSRKFSDSNCQYIDRNAWDDGLADMDPRVFQGFVWSS